MYERRLLWCLVWAIVLVEVVGSIKKGNNNAPCDIKQQKWIIILATGRSGSTTILSMVNLLPGVRITGEQDGLMVSFMDMRNHFRKLRKMRGTSWTHTRRATEDSLVYCMAQEWVKSDTPYTNRSEKLLRYGFKEIRYSDVEILGFISDAFPNAQFIISYRQNIAAQLSSASKAFPQPFTSKVFDARTNTLLEWANKRPDKVFEMPLESFSLETFSNLYKWLGFNCSATAIEHDNAHKGYRKVSKGSAKCF